MFRTNVLTGVLNLILLSGPLHGDQPVTVDVPIARSLAVAYSPSVAQVAVGGLETIGNVPIDGVVQLIDTATGARQSLLRHSGTIKNESSTYSSQNMIYSLTYSPDGSTLAVASELGLKLWDPANGQELATLLGYGIDDKNHQIKVTSVAFSPDGKLLASSGDGNRLRLWDAVKREVIREFEIGYGDHVAFSPDGTRLATAGHHNRVALWLAADGKHLAEVHAEMGPLYGVAIDPQGEHVAAVGEGGEKLWRIEKDEAGQWKFNDETRLTGHVMSPVRYVAFSTDGRLLATAGDNGTLVVYDLQTRKAVGTLLAGGPFAFSPDGKSLAVAQLLIGKLPGGARQGGTHLFIWKTADVLDVDRMAEQARTAAMDMVQTLTTPRPDRRMMQGVMAVLSGPQGNAATPILVDALKDPPVNEKELLIFALARIADRDAKARAAIIEALRTAEAVDVRTAAAGMLAQLPVEAGQEAVPALAEAALNDENPRVRSAAARTLQKLDPQAFQQTAEQVRARGPVVDRVEKSNGKLVYQGRSLEEWIKRLSVSYIPNEIFGRPRPDEPLAAIRAIGPDAVPVLVETLKNGEWPLRQAAAAGLGALGPEAKSAVEPLLDVIAAANDKSLVVAGGAADAVVLILKGEIYLRQRLTDLTKSDNPAVRLSAARAMAALAPGNPGGLPVLKAALAAATPRVEMPLMRIGPIPEGPSVGWLGRVVADEEAPLMVRIQAAETLSRFGEAALPVLPEMLQAVAAEDRNLSQQLAMSIQKVGPKAVPAVGEALAAAKDDAIRGRLATILRGLGEEGRSKFNEHLSGQKSEPLWWAAVAGAWDEVTAITYLTAVREALIRTGQPLPPQPPQLGAKHPDRFPPMYQPPSVQWSAKLLADADAPRSMRMQAATALYVVKPDELRPFLLPLLNALAREEDRSLVSQLANVIQRAGPEAIPAVKTAIDDAPTGEVRRELLRALSSMGKEGQQEFARLMQNNSEYSQLFSDSKSSKNKSQDRTRTLSSLEQNALQEAERTSRPLTNGDFTKGLEGWNTEGGAAAFRTFPLGDASFLTTWGEQQDGNTGRLFQCFKVPDDAATLEFKLHGGSNREKTYVALWRKNDRHGQVAARNDNTPFQAHFPLMPLRGEVVTLEIVDNNTDGWGFIGVEDFRIVGKTESNRHKAEREGPAFDVYLRGKKGQEIKGQVDTGSDSFVIRSWSDPSQITWTPQAGELPLTLYAFTSDGQIYDVPDDWNGKFSGWAFLLPVERDLVTVQWNEGAPTEFWQGASFGWGGLRNGPGKVVTGKGSSDETKRFRYVPMADNSTSDISFESVTIKPVPSPTPSKPLTDAEE